jgi:hypothetical protein
MQAALKLEARPNGCEPPIGTIIGGQFQLVTKFYSYGETRFLARDLKAPGQDVEMVITSFNGRCFRYQIRSRFKRGTATHLKRAPWQRHESPPGDRERRGRVKEVLGISWLSDRPVLIEGLV